MTLLVHFEHWSQHHNLANDWVISTGHKTRHLHTSSIVRMLNDANPYRSDTRGAGAAAPPSGSASPRSREKSL